MFHFSGADHGIDFGNLVANLVAEAFGEAAGDDEALSPAEFLVRGHLQYGVDGLLLRGSDEAAGVYDQHVGFVGAGGEFITVARENAHHDLAINEVFGAA